jgi:hypothetical protein
MVRDGHRPSSRFRELMPFAALIGLALEEATPGALRGRLECAPERCTTQAFHYPRA